MPGTPTERYAQTLTAQLGSSALSPAAGSAAGSLLVIAVTSGVGKQLTSVTDTKSNVWTVIARSDQINGTVATSWAYCLNAVALTTGDTITLNYSVATSGNTPIWLYEVTGVVLASALDKQVGASGTSTTPSAGSSGTLTRAVSIAFAVARMAAGGGTYTQGSGWTIGTTVQVNSGLEFQVTAATTAITANGTITSSVAWAAGMITFLAPINQTATFTASAAASAMVKRGVGVTKSASCATTATLIRSVSITRRATCATTATATRSIARTFTSSAAASATITRAVAITRIASATASATLKKTTGRVFLAIASASARITTAIRGRPTSFATDGALGRTWTTTTLAETWEAEGDLDITWQTGGLA